MSLSPNSIDSTFPVIRGCMQVWGRTWKLDQKTWVSISALLHLGTRPQTGWLSFLCISLLFYEMEGESFISHFWELSEIMTLKRLVNYEVFCKCQEGILLSQGGVQTCEDHFHPETHSLNTIKLICYLRSLSLENLSLFWAIPLISLLYFFSSTQAYDIIFLADCHWWTFNYGFIWIKRLGNSNIIICSKSGVSRIGFTYS